MTESMATRLQAALDRRGMEPPGLIAAAKLSKGAVYNILNDLTKPAKVRFDTVTRICRQLNLNRDWLVYGHGEMDAAEPSQSERFNDDTMTEAMKLLHLMADARPDDWRFNRVTWPVILSAVKAVKRVESGESQREIIASLLHDLERL